MPTCISCGKKVSIFNICSSGRCKECEAAYQERIKQQELEKQQKKELEASLKKETLKITGTSYHEKEIKNLGLESIVYDETKKDLIDDGFIDEYIYEYEFSPKNVTLEEEPDNPKDPKAIKVIIDGAHVGYIKKGKCSHVKKLIDTGAIDHINAFIVGGKYKIVHEDYDEEKDKETYEFEKGEHGYSIDLDLYIKE